MIKNKKILLGTAFATGTVGLVATPIILIELKKDKEDMNVHFNGKQFHSKSEVLNYISSHASQVEKQMGRHIYTIKNGSDVNKFSNFQDAVKFLKDKITHKKVYLKHGVTFQKDENININQFIDLNETSNYIAFEKYDKDEALENHHSYTFAELPNDEMSDMEKARANNAIESARLEAARSYIQVHSAYYFDNKYFPDLNEVKSYITSNHGSNLEADYGTTNLFALETKSNGTLVFDSKTNDKFESTISSIATPYYNTADSGPENWVKIDQNHINDIASNLDDSDVKYVKIGSNNGKITQIVDMDKTQTSSGRIYGNYFVESGLGVEGIEDYNNWTTTNDSPEEMSNLLEMDVLKSTITYLFMNHGFKSLIDIMGSVFLNKTDDAVSMNSFLNSMQMGNAIKEDGNPYTYLDSAITLVKDLSKGKKYNLLDSIVALHSFLINNMIQNNENIDNIDKIAQYFDQIALTLDSFLTSFLAPFFSSYTLADANNPFIVNYFRSAFNFYDPNTPGHSIEFQTNPNAYYRKLIGHKAEKGIVNVDEDNRNTIFNLIKAAMGVQSLSMKAIRHNAVAVDDWKKNFKNHLKVFEQQETAYNNSLHSAGNIPYSGYGSHSNSVPEPNYNNPSIPTFGNGLVDFRFKDILSSTSDENLLIWKNVEKAVNGYQIKGSNGNNHMIDNQQMLKNYNEYLQKTQNKVIAKSMSEINEKMNSIYDEYGTSHSKSFTRWSNVDINDWHFSYTSCLNDIDITLLVSAIPTEKTRLDNMERMIKSTEIPFRDRLVEFGTKVGTVATKVAIAVVTAGIATEAEMLEAEFSSALKEGVGSEKMKSFVNKLDSSSRIHQNTSAESMKQKTYSSKAFEKNQKKMINDIKNAISSGVNVPKDGDDISRKVGNFAGSIMSNIFTFNNANSAVGSSIREVLSTVYEIEFNILRNVIPGLNGLINIITSFSSNKTNVWEYHKTQDKFYWDGDIVHYSWWGLSEEHVHTIKELKTIKVHEIISGYTESQAGYYYNGKIHADLAKLKYAAALEETQRYINSPRTKDSSIYNVKNTRIKWRITLKDDSLIEGNNIKEIVENTRATLNTISKKVFVTSTGISTTSKGQILLDQVENVVKRLKPVLIIKLPTISITGEQIVDKTFELPKPYVSRGKTIPLVEQHSNDKYVVFNPNIKQDAVNANKLLEGISNMKALYGENDLEKLLNNYARNIYINNTKVLFQDLNTNDTFSKVDVSGNSYEALIGNKYSNEVTDIYSYVTKNGETRNFQNIDVALKEMIKTDNELNDMVMRRNNSFYNFDGQLFRTLNEIYEYMIKKSKGENNE